MSGQSDDRREFVEGEDEPWRLSPRDELLDEMIALEGNPERVRDTFTWGRITCRRMVHFAQPPGESESWDLWIEDDGKKRRIWSGLGWTHDLKAIKDEIFANREEIANRMRELAQERRHEPTKKQGFEQGL